MTLASILVTLRHQNELSRPGQLMIYPYLWHTSGRPSRTHTGTLTQPKKGKREISNVKKDNRVGVCVRVCVG